MEMHRKRTKMVSIFARKCCIKQAEVAASFMQAQKLCSKLITARKITKNRLDSQNRTILVRIRRFWRESDDSDDSKKYAQNYHFAKSYEKIA